MPDQAPPPGISHEDWTATPVVESRPLALPLTGLLPSARATASALAARFAPLSYPRVHTYTQFGAP